MDADSDLRGETGQRFVDGVVHHFEHTVVQAALVRVADAGAPRIRRVIRLSVRVVVRAIIANDAAALAPVESLRLEEVKPENITDDEPLFSPTEGLGLDSLSALELLSVHLGQLRIEEQDDALASAKNI